MENYNEIKLKAEDARKNQKWDKALEFYEEIYNNNSANEWDKYFYALALSKNGFGDKSMEICRQIFLAKKEFNPNNSLYARNIYNKSFDKPDYSDKKNILKALNAIKFLTPNNDKFISFEMFFHIIVKTFESDHKFDFILEIFEEFYPLQEDYKKLDDTLFLKNLNYPTFVETYMVAQIKANYMLGNYEKAITKVDETLKTIKRFNYSNQIWIRRTKALSLWKIDKKNEALQEYFYIMRIKKEWFIYFEIAQLLNETKNSEASEFFAIKALLDKQDASYKINLYKFLLEIKSEKILKEKLNEIIDLLKNKRQTLNPTAENKAIETKIKKAEEVIRQNAKDYFETQKGQGEIINTFSPKNGIIKTDSSNIFFAIETKGMIAEQGDIFLYNANWNFDLKKKEVRKSVILTKKI
ncbi:MAG: hypothetical protein JXR68_10560 [Bacteroidales bacterium]|nr:hypothetical protein [Bacteroidales bacterium]